MQKDERPESWQGGATVTFLKGKNSIWSFRSVYLVQIPTPENQGELRPTQVALTSGPTSQAGFGDLPCSC